MLNWLFRADKTADLIVRWTTMWTLMSGAFSLLSKNIDWLGTLSWPEAILVGIGCALVTMFVSTSALALGAYGFRTLRPTVEDPAKSGVVGSVAVTSNVDSDASARIDAIESQIKAMSNVSQIARAVDVNTKILGAQSLLPKVTASLIRVPHERKLWSDYIQRMATFIKSGKRPDTHEAHKPSFPPYNMVHTVGLAWPNESAPLEVIDTHGMNDDNLRKMYIEAHLEFKDALHQLGIVEVNLKRLDGECRKLLNIDLEEAEKAIIARLDNVE